MLRASGIPAQSHRHKPADTIRLGSIGIYGKSDMLNMYLICFLLPSASFFWLLLSFFGFRFLFLASAFFFWLLLSFSGFCFLFLASAFFFWLLVQFCISWKDFWIHAEKNYVWEFCAWIFSIVFVILVVCCCLESLFWRWIWIPDGQELFWVFFFLCIFLPLIIYFIGLF